MLCTYSLQREDNRFMARGSANLNTRYGAVDNLDEEWSDLYQSDDDELEFGDDWGDHSHTVFNGDGGVEYHRDTGGTVVVNTGNYRTG